MTTDMSQEEAVAQAVLPVPAEPTAPRAGAPPIRFGRPWHWRQRGGSELDIFVEDPAAHRGSELADRFAVLSCGAELHRVIVRLAATGRSTSVTRLPDLAVPGHLATVRIAHRTAVSESVPVLPRPERRTAPVVATRLEALSAAVERAGCGWYLLRADQVYDLVAATVAPGRSGDLLTADALPPAGTAGPLPEQHAVFAILYGRDDRRLSWLRAGEAFDAGSTAAAGLSILPLTDAIEDAGVRANVRRLLPGPGEPYLVLRVESGPAGGSTSDLRTVH